MKDTLHKQMEAADIQQGHVAAQKMAKYILTPKQILQTENTIMVLNSLKAIVNKKITVQSLRIQFMSLCI